MWQIILRKGTWTCEASSDIEQYFIPMLQKHAYSCDKANVAKWVSEYDNIIDTNVRTRTNWLVCFDSTDPFHLSCCWNWVDIVGSIIPLNCSFRLLGHLKHHVSLPQFGSGPLINRNDGECCAQPTRTITVIGWSQPDKWVTDNDARAIRKCSPMDAVKSQGG